MVNNKKPDFKSTKEPSFLVVFAGILLYGIISILPTAGLVNLFDWDEINFAESSREMVVSGNYFIVQIGYQPFWEKPPLFIWMQAASMKVFGISEFAARFPNFICALLTLTLLYKAGRKLYDWRIGILWATFYACSLLPAFYFHTGIIDPWFNLFIFLSILHFHYGIEKYRHFAWSGIFLGLAILTKGPVAALIAGITLIIRLLFGWRPGRVIWKGLGLVSLLAIITGGSWFALLWFNGYGELISDFIAYQIRLLTTPDAGHGGNILYHPMVLLIGCFPASIPAISALMTRYRSNDSFAVWMKTLFWVTIILFSLVTTKIIHYSSLCYFPITFLAAIQTHQNKWARYNTVLMTGIGVLIGLVLVLLPLTLALNETMHLKEMISDSFLRATLNQEVWWTGLECLTGVIFLIALEHAYHRFKEGNVLQGSGVMLIGTLITLPLVLITIAPNIEWHTQRPAIEYFREHAGENVYLRTLGYKSYADLFYGSCLPEKNSRLHPSEWYTDGQIDKPVYFVAKVDQTGKIRKQYPELKPLGQKGGYSFYVRHPSLQANDRSKAPNGSGDIGLKQPERQDRTPPTSGN